MFRKNPFRTNYSSIVSSKLQNLTVFSIIYMIRIRFFGLGELIQNGLGTTQYWNPEKVFKNLQKKLNLAEDEPPLGIEALKTSVLTIKAAICMGHNYTDSLEIYKKTNFQELQNFFHMTQRLVLPHQVEMLSVNTIE